MKSKFQKIKGTYDILPPESFLWDNVIDILSDISMKFGFEKIHTPIIEDLNLFKQNLGYETDVSKEMFTWEDQKNHHIVLKPEMTAPVVRAFIENGLYRSKPLCKLFYIDAFFRREKPQKGRQRQFHQFGVEAFGAASVEQDVEIVLLANKILNSLNINNSILNINNIGDPQSRMKYEKVLSTYFKDNIKKLSKVSINRLNKNPIRILDSKEKEDIDIIKNAPIISDFISMESKEKFSSFLIHLNSLGIKYKENNHLVRGLDYYNDTIFEITNSSGKSQNALLGGGRYDFLVEGMGGPSTPAVGFAAGIERLIIESSLQNNQSQIDFFIGFDNENSKEALIFADKLVDDNFHITIDTSSKNEKNQIKTAIKLKANYFIKFGKKITLRNLNSKKEFEINNYQDLLEII